jgi:intracellular septation protein A
MIKEFLVNQVYAQSLEKTPIVGNVFVGATLGDIFNMVVNLLITLGFGLVLVFLALGFIKFITSQGDKVATEQAQKWVTYAVIGGVGLFAVFAIRSVITTLVEGNDPLNSEE